VAVVVSEGSLTMSHTEPFRPFVNYGSIDLYSGRTEDYAAIYRTQPNVRLVVRFLGRNIAQLGLHGYRRIAAAERAQLDAGHDLAQFLKNPTPAATKPVTRHRWIRGIVEDLAIFDTAYLLKARNTATARLNGFRIPPQMMRPIGDSWLWPEGYELLGNKQRVTYPPDAVVHIFGHNPEDPRQGLSPLESLRRLLAEEASAGEWREQYWRGGARISGVIERPADAPKWSDTARNRFRSDWQAAYSGTGGEAGWTPILEEGMKFDPTSFSAKESEYLAARRLSREEAAAAYFIPPAFVGILENANFSNIKEQHVSLYADTLGPWLDWITEDLELQLLPEFDDVDDVYLEFNLEEKLRGSFEEQATAAQASVGAPWVTRNEQRARFNLPPAPGGDVLVTPLNVLVGGQASPRDSAPTGALARSKAGDHHHGTKSLPRYLLGWEAKHREILESFFMRQQESVISKLGAGLDLDEAFAADRWNEELGHDLGAVAAEMAGELGAAVAEDFGAEFDVERALPWLTENARIAAGSVNTATYDQLAEAWSGVPRRGAAGRKQIDDLDDLGGVDSDDDDLEDPLGGDSFLNPARDVFALAVTARAATIATTRATTVGQWSRREGASQAGAGSKTWVVNSANSRHAALEGETVPLGEPFSNGAQYPGDPTLGVDETAGCLCSLDFSA
jgi:HK97 family phage portal protein